MNKIISSIAIAFILFFSILCLGIPLSTIPIFVSEQLKFSGYVVAAVVLIESIVTLVSRPLAGRFSDSNTPKKGLAIGLILLLLSAVLTTIGFYSKESRVTAIVIILLSRVFMGIGESFVFTCSSTWPIALLGRKHTGKLMSWLGIAIFLGLASGNY